MGTFSQVFQAKWHSVPVYRLSGFWRLSRQFFRPYLSCFRSLTCQHHSRAPVHQYQRNQHLLVTTLMLLGLIRFMGSANNPFSSGQGRCQCVSAPVPPCSLSELLPSLLLKRYSVPIGASVSYSVLPASLEARVRAKVASYATLRRLVSLCPHLKRYSRFTSASLEALLSLCRLEPGSDKLVNICRCCSLTSILVFKGLIQVYKQPVSHVNVLELQLQLLSRTDGHIHLYVHPVVIFYRQATARHFSQ